MWMNLPWIRWSCKKMWTCLLISASFSQAFSSQDSLGAWEDTQPTTFLHPRQVLFCFFHVVVDLIHATLDSVQLFCSHVPLSLLLILISLRLNRWRLQPAHTSFALPHHHISEKVRHGWKESKNSRRSSYKSDTLREGNAHNRDIMISDPYMAYLPTNERRDT